MYAGAGDEVLRAKGGAIVEELAACQKRLGGAYLSAFPTEFFDRLRDGKKVWAPWYTVHKIMAGLLDMHQLCGNAQALAVVEGMANWAADWAAPINTDHFGRVLLNEFGGMNEVLYNVYAATGNKRYAALAHRFDHPRVLDPLAEGRDELRGLHVNTNIPKIIGAARRYELTGEARYRDIAAFFWRQVTRERAYVTGGTSNFEHWRTDPGKLAAELSAETQECCCTYNMLKLTRHLFAWTAEPRYADYYERAYLNSIVGTMNPEDGMTMYFVPLASGYWKMFGTPRNSFWCCTGTGIESFSKLADSIYFHNAGELYVNLFVPSRLDWREKGLRVRQETKFPDEPRTALYFETDAPLELGVRLRVPHWTASRVRINGVAQKETGAPSSYMTFKRVWKTGDKLEIEMPMKLHVETIPDDPGLQAFLYGPLVLAGELGAEGLTREMQYGDPKTGEHKLAGKPVAAPEFRAAGDPAAWIQPVAGRKLAFRTTGQERDMSFIPLNRLFGQRYGVYWRVRG
jgi:DUF1680 family protein